MTSLVRLQEAARQNILQPAALRLRGKGAATCHRPRPRPSNLGLTLRTSVTTKEDEVVKRKRLIQTDTPACQVIAVSGCLSVRSWRGSVACSDIQNQKKI